MKSVSEIKYIVIDVDGTMTDTGIYYDSYGNEIKRFSARDGVAIMMARNIGIKIIVLTGRECNATKKRMEELHIDVFEQSVKDKAEYLGQYIRENDIKTEQIGYIGDDLNDLKAMDLVGYIGCPVDSCKEVCIKADYISSVKGGYGAVRDVIEHMLKLSGKWEASIKETLGI